MIKQAPFKPTDIGGCKAWFDAFDASYTTTGNTITAWTNKSGNANATTGSGTVSINQATLNGKSSVRFPAGTNYLNIGSISYSTSYRNQFFVVTVAASGSFYFYLNCNDTICGQCYSWNDSDIEINKFGTLGLRTYPTGYFNSTSIVSICTSSGGNTGIFVNGVSQSLADNNVGTGGFWSTGTATGITLGGQNGFTTGNLDMYELLQYDGDLTRAQRQQVESYLAQKWGLRQQLPQGHPGTQGIVYPQTPLQNWVPWRYAAAFVPSVAGTVSMWLDGADPAGTGVKPSNGATVSTWVDKSGNGKNLTAVGTPTYVTASSSVYLNGSSYLQNTNFSFTIYTIFIVSVQASDQGPLYTTTTSGAGSSGFFPRYSNGNYYLATSDGDGWLSAASTFVNGTTYIYSIQYDSLNNINLWSNGSILPVITGTAGTLTRNMFILGKRNVGGFQENMTGNVFEVVQYNSDIGQTSRQQVEGYLAWKWGLQANLPANHPYKNASPTTTNPGGVSRPPNVLPIPSIRISARAIAQQAFGITGANSSNIANGYYFYYFTSPTATAVISNPNSKSITIFALGGGGGGGYFVGGGGGAGGLQTLTSALNGSYSITVGNGGAGSTGPSSTGPPGSNGSNTTVIGSGVSITALGGGGGGTTFNVSGANGGCGGGAPYGSSAYGTGSQGYNGQPAASGGLSGGGGGVGGAGGHGGLNKDGGYGYGGTAVSTYIDGIQYGGGGGAGNNNPGNETGGFATSGGGAGALDSVLYGNVASSYAKSGTSNTGGGGGGGGNVNQASTTNVPLQNGGSGGSGIVILSYVYP